MPLYAGMEYACNLCCIFQVPSQGLEDTVCLSENVRGPFPRCQGFLDFRALNLRPGLAVILIIFSTSELFASNPDISACTMTVNYAKTHPAL